jgi:hypothetical protein
MAHFEQALSNLFPSCHRIEENPLGKTATVYFYNESYFLHFEIDDDTFKALQDLLGCVKMVVTSHAIAHDTSHMSSMERSIHGAAVSVQITFKDITFPEASS